MNQNIVLKKIILASSFTAMSVVIDVFFKSILNISNFGLPFYAIPIVLGSIILGPIYGIGIALIADAFGVMMSGYAYLPLYALAAVFWGLIPGLFNQGKISKAKLIVSIFVAYLFANMSNTFANYYYFGYGTALTTLAIRLSLLPFNAVIIYYVTYDVGIRLQTFIQKYQLINQEV